MHGRGAAKHEGTKRIVSPVSFLRTVSIGSSPLYVCGPFRMMQHLDAIAADPVGSLLVVGNLILIESLLSVDNAAVLATMVMDLPTRERNKALKYGIIGAYAFRGLCLLFASLLVKIWWLKPLGGIYLLMIFWNWYKGKRTPAKSDDLLDKRSNWFYRRTSGLFGAFWATVILVELMDLAFSIDNVFAAVAFTDNIVLIWVGVFIGILAMRFVAQGFVRLMSRFPYLESAAFIVLAILGLKLGLSVLDKLLPGHWVTALLSSHRMDLFVSLLTIAIFIGPIPIAWLITRLRR